MNPRWLKYPHAECPECGGSVEILTSCPQNVRPEDVPDDCRAPWVYDSDQWRCDDGHRGEVSCDSESPISLGYATRCRVPGCEHAAEDERDDCRGCRKTFAVLTRGDGDDVD